MSHSCFPFVIFSSFASQLRLRPGSKTVHSNQNWRSGVAVTRETHTNVWTEYAKGKDNWTLISLHTLCIIQHTCCGRPPLRTARHLIGGHSCDKIDLPLQFFGCHAPGMDTLHAMNLPQMNQLDLPGWWWGLLVSERLRLRSFKKWNFGEKASKTRAHRDLIAAEEAQSNGKQVAVLSEAEAAE